MDQRYDTIIIGSGPAGLTAGIYSARANLKTLIIAGSKWGGQLMLTTLVENFPGFPEGIQGPDLMMNMRKQAENMGAKIVDEDVVDFEFESKPFKVNKYIGDTVLLATGALTKWLEVPGEDKLIGRGVSTCAPCDAAFFRDKKVIVVGGGDAAMEEALVLTKFAEEVTIVHRKLEFKASKVMQDRVLNHEKIKVYWNTSIDEIFGETNVKGVSLRTNLEGLKNKDFISENTTKLNSEKEILWEMPTDGVFVAIGHKPASDLFAGKIELDEKGFILRKNGTMTSIEGIFVAGDVHDHKYKQAITAAAYGCEAALEIEKYLELRS